MLQNKRRSHRKRLLHFKTVTRAKSLRVVHVEFDRMRGHLEALDLGHLQLDIAVDEVIVEYAAGLEEGPIGIEA